MVDVNVAKEDETLDMMGVMVQQLMEQRSRAAKKGGAPAGTLGRRGARRWVVQAVESTW